MKIWLMRADLRLKPISQGLKRVSFLLCLLFANNCNQFGAVTLFLSPLHYRVSPNIHTHIRTYVYRHTSYTFKK